MLLHWAEESDWATLQVEAVWQFWTSQAQSCFYEMQEIAPVWESLYNRYTSAELNITLKRRCEK